MAAMSPWPAMATPLPVMQEAQAIPTPQMLDFIKQPSQYFQKPYPPTSNMSSMYQAPQGPVDYSKMTSPNVDMPQPDAQAAMPLTAPQKMSGGGGGATTLQLPPAGPTPTIQDAIDRLNAGNIDSLKNQGLSVAALKKQLGETTNKDLPLDLTPLAALTDAWTGSKFADSYKPTETYKDRQAAIAKLRDEIQKSEGSLSENEMRGLKDQLTNQFQMSNMERMDRQNQIQNDFERQKIGLMAQKANDKPEGKIMPDAPLEKYRESLRSVDQISGIKDLIENNKDAMGPVGGGIFGKNPYDEQRRTLDARFKSSKQLIAKMIEGGVLRAEDEPKYDAIMPNISDTPGVARSKAMSLEAMLKKDMANYMDVYGRAGYNVSGFADQTAKFKQDAADLTKATGGSSNGSGSMAPTAKDSQAMNWAQQIMNDPKASAMQKSQAQQIMQLNKGK